VTETAEEFIARKSRAWADELARAIRTKDIGRQGNYYWLREAWTWHVQHNYREKVFVIERLRMKQLVGISAHEGGAQVGDIEYRFGYYVVGRIGQAAGRWWWGQSAPFIPRQDLRPLLEKARADGTLLD
jgi:hypothetical protein